MAIDPPLEWSVRAVKVLAALRHGVDRDGVLSAKSQAVAIAQHTLPGESLIGAALRRSEIWPDAFRVVDDYLSGRGAYPPGSGRTLLGVEAEAESSARREGARRVAERHLLRALNLTDWATYNIRVPALQSFVEREELGRFGDLSSLRESWHGLVDTSIIVQFHELRSIDWRTEAGSDSVFLWLPGSVLNELDYLAAQGDSLRVKEKARAFIRWLRPLMQASMAADGAALRDDGRVRLRVVATPTPLGLRDTDHLEAALELRDAGLPITVVTADAGLTSRAMAVGLVSMEPNPDRWRLPPDPGPKDIETQARLKRASLEAPPILSCECRFESSTGFLHLISDSAGGQAKSVRVVWKVIGGALVGASDALRDYRTMSVYEESGRYQQVVGSAVPPGARMLLSQFNYTATPARVDYEIWAEGADLARGSISSG